MNELFESSGMLVLLAIIVVIQALSLVILWLNIRVYRNQSKKYESLFESFGNSEAWGKPGRIAVPIYMFTIFIVTVITTAFFIFQPHIL